MPPGSYFVQADPKPGQGYVDTYFRDVFDELLATPVIVTAGQETSSIDIALPMGGTMSGLVTRDATGGPMAGIRISVRM